MKILLGIVGFFMLTSLLMPVFAQDINDTLNETEQLGDLLNETEEITNETLKELEKLNQEFEEKLEKVK